MPDRSDLKIELKPYGESVIETDYNLDKVIYDLDNDIDLLSSQADQLDYIISIGSGVLCGLLDILWVGEFSLQRGNDYASGKINEFVVKTAKLLGCTKDDLESAVRFLEKKYPIPSDGNTPHFGGGLQHHLRDFAHHPTIVGMIFSLLTQFTGKSYGTNTQGVFMVVDVPEKSKAFIGDDIPTKIMLGTITWFFHLVSDVAGSSSSVIKSGGTGIPGPLLALAKEISTLPVFNNISIEDNSLSVFLAKLFNGTLLAEHDESEKMIPDTISKMDLRAELGIGIEIGRQAIPVIANECIVRSFFLIRRLGIEIRANQVESLSEMKHINWSNIKPYKNPTISRMMLIATGVFTSVDIGDAIIRENYWLSVNYVGVGRFIVAINEDVAWGLKCRNVKKIRQAYKEIQRFSFTQSDNNIYERIGDGMSFEKHGLTIEQTEILYNIEYHKTLNDIKATKLPFGVEKIQLLKESWLDEWKDYMSNAFPHFLNIEDAKLNWLAEKELLQKIERNNPQGTWFRLVLLEAMLFEPYFPLDFEEDEKGKKIPSKKYSSLQGNIKGQFVGYREGEGDKFLDSFFDTKYYEEGYIKRLRKSYGKVLWELSETLKTAITSLSIASFIAIATVMVAGIFAPGIAVFLVGSNFAGLGGVALANASLAYLGGGAVAAGGLGMFGGTMVVVGGGAILGTTVGLGAGGAVGVSSLLGKKYTILQSAKLLVSVKEIFLKDEYDFGYSTSVYEQYVQNIRNIEKDKLELELKANVASSKEKKILKEQIKNTEKSIEVMKHAMKLFNKSISGLEE